MKGLKEQKNEILKEFFKELTIKGKEDLIE
mgnify:CR=1 FL=1